MRGNFYGQLEHVPEEAVSAAAEQPAVSRANSSCRYTEFEIDPEHFKKLMATFNVTLHHVLPLKVFFSLQPQAPMFVKLGQLQAKNQNEYVRCSLC